MGQPSTAACAHACCTCHACSRQQGDAWTLLDEGVVLYYGACIEAVGQGRGALHGSQHVSVGGGRGHPLPALLASRAEEGQVGSPHSRPCPCTHAPTIRAIVHSREALDGH